MAKQPQQMRTLHSEHDMNGKAKEWWQLVQVNSTFEQEGEVVSCAALQTITRNFLGDSFFGI